MCLDGFSRHASESRPTRAPSGRGGQAFREPRTEAPHLASRSAMEPARRSLGWGAVAGLAVFAFVNWIAAPLMGAPASLGWGACAVLVLTGAVVGRWIQRVHAF